VVGQKLPNSDVRIASVHPSMSDTTLHRRERRKGPITDIGSRLFDHLVGAGKDCSRHSEAERLGRRISHSV
jgi:hypothetical protein